MKKKRHYVINIENATVTDIRMKSKTSFFHEEDMKYVFESSLFGTKTT